MKGKLLITAMLGTLVASNAFASIARQAVFGNQPVFTSAATSSSVSTVVNGSLWYDDEYNVFYNPSYVMDNKNYVTFDKGMEGGFFKGLGENFAYGLYFNRGGATSASSGNTAYGGSQFQAPGIFRNNAFVASAAGSTFGTQRPLDVFFAGDTGIKWGFHASWAYNRNQTTATKERENAEQTARYWHFDLGAQVMGLEPFVGATLFSKYQDDLPKNAVVQDLNEFNIGARYKYEGWTPYVVFKKFRQSGNNSPGFVNAQGMQLMSQDRMNTVGAGVGHDTKVADGVHIMKHIAYFRNSVEADVATTERPKDYYEQIVPINLTLEAEATSWLTLRAGATYDLFNTRQFSRDNAVSQLSVNDRNQSQAGNARVRLGSTFKFGKLHVDSAFGNGTASGGDATGVDNSAIGFDSNLFALVSASYHW